MKPFPSLTGHPVRLLLPMFIILALIIACGDAATPQVTEREVEVIREVEVEVPVQVPVTQEVIKEVTIAEEVPVTQIVEREVQVTVVVPVAAPTHTPAPTPTAPPEGSLNIGFREVGTFGTHPRLTPGSQGVFIGSSLGETLLIQDSNQDFQPRLASEWSLSDDSLVWTFKINEGIQFHNDWGELTADDVIWSMEQYGGEGSRASNSGKLRRLWSNEAGGATAVDRYTVEVNTGTPQFDMLIVASQPSAANVFSKRQVEELGEDEASRQGAATGPWQIDEAKSGQYWKFKAVPNHWRKTPEFGELVFWDIPEESIRVANFQVGLLDTFLMALDSKPVIEKVPDVKFMRVQGGGTVHLGLNGNWYVGLGTPEHLAKHPSYDPEIPWISGSADVNSEEWQRALKVRRALHIAIDRQAIVDTILRGEGKAEVLWGWENNMHRLPDRMQQWEFNPELAKRLLAEAGYPEGFDITITPDIRNVPGEIEACDAVGTMWENIGINVRINHVPYATISPILQAREYNQANCHGTGGRADPRELIHTFSSTGGFSAGFHHPTMDALLTQALETVDTEAAYTIMVQAAEFLFDNAAESSLYSVNIIWPLSANVDEWIQHLQYGDRRALTSFEWTPHR